MKPSEQDLETATDLISKWEQTLHRANTMDAHNDLVSRIASAIASEREKAAKIAESQYGNRLDSYQGKAGLVIAAAIRANKE